MKRIRRSKKRNYTIFIILSALLLTVGYATFAQPLAHRLAVILPDGSRFGLWDGIINKDDNNGNNSANNNGNSDISWNSSSNGRKGDSNSYNRGSSGGNGNISNKQWDVSFVGADKIDASDGVFENGGVVFNRLFASFDVLFHKTGDSITYDFMIKNMGELSAKLDGYDIVTTNESNYKFDVEGLTEGDVLNVGQKAIIRIKTTFIGSPTDYSSTQGGKITVSLRYVQK